MPAQLSSNSKTITEHHKIRYKEAYEPYELPPYYWEFDEVFNTHGLPIEIPYN
jgi:hypothetical protein